MSLPTVECFRGMNIIDQLAAIYEATLQVQIVPKVEEFRVTSDADDRVTSDGDNRTVLV
jgi:hypothetical protein